MKVLRLKLRQNKASYSREETVTNRMTYPLPPFSTIIGALHNTCGYDEYHPMNISIQGNYQSLNKEIYISNSLLNRKEDDRNILIYLNNPNLLSTGYTIVGEGLKAQGNSFSKDVTVRIKNKHLHKKYKDLYLIKEQLDIERLKIIKPKEEKLNKAIKELNEKIKKTDKNTKYYNLTKKELSLLKKEKKDLKNEYKSKVENLYEKPMSHYKTLVKAPQYQEVLYGVELLIHISSDEKTIEAIEENINNLVSIGRSEDFVDLLEIKRVEVFYPKEDIELKNDYKIYVDLNKIKNDPWDENIYYFNDGNNRRNAKGTVYYLNKNYEIINNKRNFKKIPCLYSSYLGLDFESEGGIVDEDGYIVDLN